MADDCFWWDDADVEDCYSEDNDSFEFECDMGFLDDYGDDCGEIVCPPGCIPDPCYNSSQQGDSCCTPTGGGGGRRMSGRVLFQSPEETPPFIEEPCEPPPGLERDPKVGPLSDAALISRFALWGVTRPVDQTPPCSFEIYEDSPTPVDHSLEELLRRCEEHQRLHRDIVIPPRPRTPVTPSPRSPYVPAPRIDYQPRSLFQGECEEECDASLGCEPLPPCETPCSPQVDPCETPCPPARGSTPPMQRIRERMARGALFESPPRRNALRADPCADPCAESPRYGTTAAMQSIRERMARRTLFDSPPRMEPTPPREPCPETPRYGTTAAMQRIRERMVRGTLFDDSCGEEEMPADECLYDMSDCQEYSPCLEEPPCQEEVPCSPIPMESPCVSQSPCPPPPCPSVYQETPCITRMRPSRRGVPRWPYIEAARIAEGRSPRQRPSRARTPTPRCLDRSVRTPTPGVSPMTRQRREFVAQYGRSPHPCELVPRKPLNKNYLRM